MTDELPMPLPRALPPDKQAWEDMHRQAKQYAVQSHAEGTLKAYRSAWNAYSAWCEAHSIEALSADPEKIAIYATYLAHRLSLSSIKVHLAAIVRAHRAAGKQLDLKHPSLHPVLEGIARKKGRRPSRQATPALPDALKRMVDSQPNTPPGKRNRAMLLIGFGAAMRRSELTALTVEDVEFHRGRGVMVHIRRSKTDQYSEGGSVAIALAADPVLCATSALKDWLSVYKPESPSSPLFCAILPNQGPTNERLHDRTVARIIKEAAVAAGLPDPASYSGHSLRAGLLTAASEEGVELPDAMRQSRHKSVQVAIGYMRPASLWKNNATDRIWGKTRA